MKDFPFPKLNLPCPELKIKEIEGSFKVWDVLRKKNLVLTPEEWVRQHWIHLLHNQYGFPIPLMSAEKNALGSVYKSLRFDLLCFNRKGEPKVLVECKQPEVKINDIVLKQAMDYIVDTPVEYIILTNGLSHILFKRNGSDLMKINKLPSFTELINQ